MKKIVFLLSISIVLIITSCNKNIRVSKQIDGEWNIDELLIEKDSNSTIIYNETFYNFGTFLFNNNNSMGVVDTEVGSFIINNYFLSYDGSVLNIEYDSSGENIKYAISNYVKKSEMTLTSESTSQGVKTTSIYTLSKK